MKELSANEMLLISGGYQIRPSDWTTGAALGMFCGAGVYTATAFSAHPLGLAFTLTIGALYGAGLCALHDVLRYIESGFDKE